MIVSWDWLQQYVKLDVTPDEVARRLMLAGLNHEKTTEIDGDFAIDLEITSNRPDCLGHIGVAREAAVLFGQELKLPAAAPLEEPTPVAELTSVKLECPTLCPRYTARVIRGVKVRPSPQWFARHLTVLGLTPVNNVVDITNYVLMECGQPLHAFDLGKLRGQRIIVRASQKGEQFLAINHKAYTLEEGMCVIADAERTVALGGVMGGAETEVTIKTVDLLIESAEFSPLSIRDTARKLNLHSDSSYRFERALDPEGVDWASRRCCELILEFAGGELAMGVVDVGRKPVARAPVTLRLSQIARILGIEIPTNRVREILQALGNREVQANATQIEVIPPTWRGDLTREIDLIEEVARIHGYDEIPEDVRVPMAPSQRSPQDRVLNKVRSVLTAAGFNEALTLSVVERDWSEAFSPWTETAPLMLQTPILRRADTLRRSLIPSLLGARRTNESVGNPRIELFETAKAYLATSGELPSEPLLLGLTSGGDYAAVKGVIEEIVAAIRPDARVDVRDAKNELFARGKGVELLVGGETLGYLGEISSAGLKKFELRSATTVAEIRLSLLNDIARLIPKTEELSPYPAVTRDVNLVVDERVRWSDVAETIRTVVGLYGERLEYLDTYRDAKRLGEGKKSLLFSLVLRSKSGTLLSEEADAARDRVVSACGERHAAVLRQ